MPASGGLNIAYCVILNPVISNCAATIFSKDCQILLTMKTVLFRNTQHDFISLVFALFYVI